MLHTFVNVTHIFTQKKCYTHFLLSKRGGSAAPQGVHVAPIFPARPIFRSTSLALSTTRYSPRPRYKTLGGSHRHRRPPPLRSLALSLSLPRSPLAKRLRRTRGTTSTVARNPRGGGGPPPPSPPPPPRPVADPGSDTRVVLVKNFHV